MTQLTQHVDGIAAVDLGTLGSRQYALDFLGPFIGQVWARSASEVGTYGGWRFECGAHAVTQYPNASPDFPELAARIDVAVKAYRALHSLRASRQEAQ